MQERDRHIRAIERHGRREWYKLSGYTKRSMVENAVYRYKAIIGPEMRARTLARQRVEHRIGCETLNKMEANRNLLTAMRLLPKSIHWCRRYPTKFNSGRDIPRSLRLYSYPKPAVDVREPRPFHGTAEDGERRATLSRAARDEP